MLNSIIRRIAVVLLVCASLAQAEDFCFIQMSDVHIEPQPVGSPPIGADDRSVGTLAWICEQARQPQVIEAVGLQAGKPAFAVCTGDLMEFGAVGRTFETFMNLLKPLPAPLYVVPGNHDNTWGGMLQMMRDKYGGDHYSFDRFGCHFIFFDSATPQEPSPSLEQRTLTFLKNDLRKVKSTTPVFMFCHHPITSGEYAKPYEQLRFLQQIQGWNVVALVMGHGHQPVSEKWGRLDAVMGGSTFGPNTGYSILSVQGDTLRVVYRFRDDKKRPKVLLEKSIKPRSLPAFVEKSPPVMVSGGLQIAAELAGGRLQEAVTVTIDDDPKRATTLKADANRISGVIPPGELAPGLHFVYASTRIDGYKAEYARPFEFRSPRFGASRVELPAGMKAAPLVTDDGILAATTAGEIYSLATGRDRPRLVNNLGAEVLYAPRAAGGMLYAGCGTGTIYCLDRHGKTQWKRDVGASAYGTPAVDDARVYVGDLQGSVHALDRKTGKPAWSKSITGWPIEQSLLLHNGVLYFGAWDGMVYAVSAADGAVKWKVRSPGGQTSSKLANRYYAAADASPLIIGERLIFADRSYHLGSYNLDGTFAGEIATGVAAIGLSEDGKCFYARTLDAGVAKYDGTGQKLWSTKVPAGRFPIAPTESKNTVYVCSNAGLVSALGAADGSVLWQYQATPQLHVMAPVSVDAAGRAWVAGMDGSVTCVAFAQNPQAAR